MPSASHVHAVWDFARLKEEREKRSDFPLHDLRAGGCRGSESKKQ